MGKKMAGTNECAFFRCKSICTGGGGVQNQAEKNSKNAFRPVPVQKFTFPVEVRAKYQNKRAQIRPPMPSSVSSDWERTYINSHPLVEDTPAEDLLAAGGGAS